MVRHLRQYSKAFKQESVSLALSYANVNQAAKELGIPGPTLHEWVNKAKSTGHCVIQGDDGSIKYADVGKLIDENKELRKRLSRLEQEKEILKKAATYFAKELG
jgi:transposase